MKLSNLTAKLTCITKLTSIKRTAFRALAVATLAGAALTAAAPAAQAQQYGNQSRYAPIYVGPRHDGFAPRYDRFREDQRAREFREHEEWVRHQQWERFHHDHYGYYGR